MKTKTAAWWVATGIAMPPGADQGVKLCDTYSEGRWQFVCDGPHKGARIIEVSEVRKVLGV
jgi:hypothetical protein